MAKCQAGDCAADCPGCGCLADSDDPVNCFCICGEDKEDKKVKPLKLALDSLVDVSIKDLNLVDAAVFIDAHVAGHILVRAASAYKQVSFEAKKAKLSSVLTRLGLVHVTTEESASWLNL